MYRYINTLSIDISIGAVIVSCFFCLIFNVPANGLSLLVLGLSVWIIYSVDHLLDAKNIVSPATTFRHQFHQENFTFLAGVTIVVGIVTAILIVLFLERSLVLAGLTVGGIAMLYLAGQRFLLYFKETIGAILYTGGVLIPAVCHPDFSTSRTVIFLVLQFFLVVLMNLMLFSYFDKNKDRLNNQVSLATQVGSTHVNRLVWIIFFLTSAVSMINIFYFSKYSLPSIVILLMAIALAAIQSFPTYFSQHDRFRYVGDGIFFVPLLYGLFP